MCLLPRKHDISKAQEQWEDMQIAIFDKSAGPTLSSSASTACNRMVMAVSSTCCTSPLTLPACNPCASGTNTLAPEQNLLFC